MKKSSKFASLLFAIGMMSLSGAAYALFDNTMNQQQLAAEIKAQIRDGSTLEMIARGASAAGMKPTDMTAQLIYAGQYPAAVVTALINAFPQDQVSIAIEAVKTAPNQAASILGAAIAAAPQQRQAITTAVLILPGINPAMVLAATAAGNAGAPATPALLILPARTPSAGGGRGNCRGRACPASPA
jgi:hypothetical protein